MILIPFGFHTKFQFKYADVINHSLVCLKIAYKEKLKKYIRIYILCHVTSKNENRLEKRPLQFCYSEQTALKVSPRIFQDPIRGSFIYLFNWDCS